MPTPDRPSDADARPSNFIRDLIDADLAAGRHDEIVTRFPPEPNGYLHIGHAKSICLNFGIAADYGGRCNLRFDDTNPETEDEEYAASIRDSVRWLGFDWEDRLFYASDYFERFYAYAQTLIRQGDAYVDSLSEDEIRAHRGTVTEPGRPSPYRDRSVEENLALFQQMREGAFPDGAHVLRAKIDMASVNMKMRDPLLYRIKRAHHYRTGDRWCIYPFYDFAHPLEDAIEGITHSLCTLEFDNNRELYDWVLEHCLPPDERPSRPHQYEFARLNLDYTVMSKRKLLKLVQEGRVDGWDDPRLPTIAGMRRRGIRPEAIRLFCDRIGVTKTDSRIDVGLLEHTVRDDLNFEAPRVLCVLKPVKVVLTNYPEDEVEWLDASYWPHDVPKEGTRPLPFARELYIDADDFMEDPPKKFFRLSPGAEVRLRHAYIIRCDEVVKDDDGRIVELRCTYDPETRSGTTARRVKGTIHWVSAAHAVPAEVRLYDRLFREADPEGGEGTFLDALNPDSAVALTGAYVEPSVRDDDPARRYQFERHGYFWQDPQDSSPDALVFNRIVPLRDTWSKLAQETAKAEPSRSKPMKTTPTPPPEHRDPVEDFDDAQRARFDRFHDGLGIDRDDAAILAQDAGLAAFYEQALEGYDAPQPVANWVVNELLRELKDRELADLPFAAPQLGRLVQLMDEDVLNSRAARTVFDAMLASGDAPDAIVEQRGLRQIDDDDALAPVVQDVLAALPDKVTQYRDGKTGLMGLFVGQVMRRTNGRANPERVKALLADALNG